MAHNENNRIMTRENRRIAAEALLIQAAIGSVIAGGDHFNSMIKELNDGR